MMMQTQVELDQTPEALSAMREEAERILSHAAFRQSERCSRLFRFLLEVTLRNPSTPIKERTVGHDVFGRPPGYDTAADPIVRNVASETRRRLRQYEHESDPRRPVRISLPAGQYMLAFSFCDEETSPPPAPIQIVQAPTFETPPTARNSRSFMSMLALLALMIPVSLLVGYRMGHRPIPVLSSPPNYFWDSFTDGHTRTIVSLETEPRAKEPIPRTGMGAFAPTLAYGNITGVLASRHQPYRMRPMERTSVDDMRDTPTILIASLDSPIVNQLLAPLHFYTGIDREREEIWIADRSNAAGRWTAPLSWPTATNQVGYAIVARLKNSITGGDVIIASGQSALGTLVASDFISNPRFVPLINQRFRKPEANIEIVLRLHSIQGTGVSPEIVSSYSW